MAPRADPAGIIVVSNGFQIPRTANCGCRQSWHNPMQWLSLPNHHHSSMQMEAEWISCHQAPSFSVTMGTASSVSCMLEAMNRELSSLIHLHIEDMEKTPLAYSAAYSNICESRRRMGPFVHQIPMSLKKMIAQSSPLGWVWGSEPTGARSSPFLQGGAWRVVPGLRMLSKVDTLTLCHQGTFSPPHASQNLHIWGTEVWPACCWINHSTPPKPLAWSSTRPRETS